MERGLGVVFAVMALAGCVPKGPPVEDYRILHSQVWMGSGELPPELKKVTKDGAKSGPAYVKELLEGYVAPTVPCPGKHARCCSWHGGIDPRRINDGNDFIMCERGNDYRKREACACGSP